ncbi:MAG: GtrA family protein [Candidatus Nomurabacteria bacterium]
MLNIFKENKIVRYIFSGGVAVFANLTILFVLTKYLHMFYLISAIIAFCFGVLVSYSLHKFWTFKNYLIGNMSSQFYIFFIYSILILCLNTILMYLSVDIFGLWYIFSQVIITIITSFINYLYFSRTIFI